MATKRVTAKKAPITKVLKKKAAKMKAKAVPKVGGFARTDITRHGHTGGVHLVINSTEDGDMAEFTISNLDNRISLYCWAGDREDKQELLSTLGTLADHILEFKWYIEDNHSEGNT